MCDHWWHCRHFVWFSNPHHGLGCVLLEDGGESHKTRNGSSVCQCQTAQRPHELRFLLDAETLRKGLNFTFVTDVGDLDLLGEVRGIGFYDKALERASSFQVLGYEFKVIALDKLILAKRALGRAKDLIAVAELETLLEQQERLNES